MKFYKNELPGQANPEPDKRKFAPIKEIKSMLLLILAYMASSFLILGFIVGIKKFVFGLPVRVFFSFIDIIPPLLIEAIVALLIIRGIIKLLSFMGRGFLKNIAFGYHLKSFSFFITYEAPLSKIRRIISLVAPIFIITFAMLIIIKSKDNRGIFFYLYILYANAFLSFADLLTAIMVGLTPKGSKTIEYKQRLYYTLDTSIEAETSEAVEESAEKEEAKEEAAIAKINELVSEEK